MDEAVVEAAALCRYDPLAWSRFAFDWGYGELTGYRGARQWQTEAFADIAAHLKNPETRHMPMMLARASGHGIGKSAFIGMLVNWALSTCDDCKVVLTSNTDTQLRTKTAPEVGKWQRLSITRDWFDVSATSIAVRDKSHAKTWRADFVPWSEHNTEAFAGLHNKGKRILLVFDEPAPLRQRRGQVDVAAVGFQRGGVVAAFGQNVFVADGVVGDDRDVFGFENAEVERVTGSLAVAGEDAGFAVFAADGHGCFLV